MPKTEETWMDGITTEMMEHICDDLCKYPDQLSEMELEDKCAECKMGRFVCDILNQYNKVIDFENSQRAKMMNEIHELKKEKMREQTFEDILYMIKRSCDKNFYKGTDYDGLKPEIVRCATNIYIEQMRQNGGKENE
jgi:hypothetical protein|nr:MAG TPA: hypothetical protein [Caudoviricetes sp.]